MKKGPQRHPTEVIQKAIARFQAGEKLSTIARDLGIEKSTVHYWLQNMEKFAGNSNTGVGVSRAQTRFSKQASDILYMTLIEIKKKLPEASLKDLVNLMEVFMDRQTHFTKTTGTPIPPRILERSEEVSVTVKRYLASQTTATDTPPPDNLSEEGVQQVECQEPAEAEIAASEPEQGQKDGE